MDYSWIQVSYLVEVQGNSFAFNFDLNIVIGVTSGVSSPVVAPALVLVVNSIMPHSESKLQRPA